MLRCATKVILLTGVLCSVWAAPTRADPIAIGTLTVFGDGLEFPFLELLNSTNSTQFIQEFGQTATFTDVSLRFWENVQFGDGSVVPSGDFVRMGDGSVRVADGSVVPSADSPVLPGSPANETAFWFLEFLPLFGDPSSPTGGFAAITFSLVGGTDGRQFSGLVFAEPLALPVSCSPDALEGCGSTTIYFDAVSVPEPATGAAVLLGLLAAATRWFARRPRRS
jgi:hypothetical protein